MKLSAQEEYGLRCLLQLARHAPGESLAIPEISQAEGITHHNVAKLLRILRQGGIVASARGQAGGRTHTSAGWAERNEAAAAASPAAEETAEAPSAPKGEQAPDLAASARGKPEAQPGGEPEPE